MQHVRRVLKRLGDDSGANLLEAAVILPLLLILTFSIVDFSSLLYTYLALENGVSQATRYAVTGNAMDDPNKPGQKLSREGSIKSAMRKATPAFTLADSNFAFSHLTPGSQTWAGGTGGPNDIGKVTITYTWSPLTPIIKPFLTNGKMIVMVDSAMKNESKFE